MNIFKHIPWFRRGPALPSNTVYMEQMMKGNPLWGANPDRLVRAVTGWDAGYISDMARLIEAYELHDDTAKSCVRKRDSAVARCEHTILIEEGSEDDPRAQLHRDILKKFWAGIRCTSAFNRSQKGGLRLLKKQMMSAQSIGWSCHNIVWDISNPKAISAEFIHLPMWHFENITGVLRFKPLATDVYGVPMVDGEWLVNTGDAIGPAVALACCTKRLSLQDWMLFSERAATPGLLGKTGAMPGTDAWKEMTKMLKDWGRQWTGLVDRDTDITTVSLNGSGEPPMPRLVERMDRAIATLYRGADLSTISKGEGLGASLQGEESDILEADDCIALSEALHEQVDRFVIRYMTGDDEPLAYIWIEPVSKPNIDAEIKMDDFLLRSGIKLSKRDMLQRYGRTEADPNDPEDIVEVQGGYPDPAASAPGGFVTQKTPLQAPQNAPRGLPNAATPFKNGEMPFKNAPQNPGGPVGGFSAERVEGPSRASGGATPEELLKALAKDTQPAADAITRFLQLLEAGATDEQAKAEAASIIRDIPGMLPEDPAGAAVIADAMAEAYADATISEEDLPFVNEANFDESKHPRATDGKFTDGSGDSGSAKDSGSKVQFNFDRKNVPSNVSHVNYELRRFEGILTRMYQQGRISKEVFDRNMDAAVDVSLAVPIQYGSRDILGWIPSRVEKLNKIRAFLKSH